MSECLANIKTLKIFAWVDLFEERLAGIREQELSAQFGKFCVGICVIAFTFLFP